MENYFVRGGYNKYEYNADNFKHFKKKEPTNKHMTKTTKQDFIQASYKQFSKKNFSKTKKH